jgi:hypothetical protein
MAKSKVGSLKAVLSLEDEQFQAKMAEAAKKVTELEKRLNSKLRSLDKVGKSMARFGKTLTQNITMPIIAAFGAIALFTKKVSDNADQIDQWAIRSGLARSTVQKMQFAMDQVGGSFDTMQKASIKVQKALYDSTVAENEQSKALKELGVESTDSSGKLRKIDEVLPEVIGKLQGMEDVTRRNALAATIFGSRMVSDIIPTLEAGAGSFEALMKRADELGIVLSDEQVRVGDAFGDMWSRITRQLMAAATRISTSLIPILNSTLVPLLDRIVIPLLDKFANLVGWLGSKFQEMPPWVKAVATIFGALLVAIGPIIFVGGKLISWVTGLFKLLVPVIAAIKSFGAAVAAATLPIWLKIAALAALAAIVAVVVRNWGAFSSWWGNMWNQIVRDTLKAVQDISFSLAGWLYSLGKMPGLGDKVLDFAMSLNSGLGLLDDKLKNSTGVKTFGELMDIVVNTAKGDWESLKATIQGVFDLFSTQPKEFDLPPPLGPGKDGEEGNQGAKRWAVDTNEALLTATDTLQSAAVQQGATLAEIGSVAMEQAKIFIRAKMFEAISGYVASALTTVPFPFGLIAAGVAAAGATALFNSLIPFAEGGIVSGPTAALIGEAGPEVVFPLNRLDKFIGNENVNVTGVVWGDNIYLANKRAAKRREKFL